MHKTRILTGITPTGRPHLGNYLGAFLPALSHQNNVNTEAFYFIADSHSLVKLWDAKLRIQYTQEVAATWLALGLDPNKAIFYRQSHIPEIFELNWILTSITAKGLMNRAHAYKDHLAKNKDENEPDPDAGMTMGLYSYPILMSADILLFNADQVPVGKDQLQHIEMTRDIATRFNHLYGKTLTLPQALLEEKTPILPGLDGRKMSKSYQNTIPLFLDSSALRKLIMKIKTNSQGPGEPKSTENCTVFSIYSACATEAETKGLKQAYLEGISWADAKQALFDLVNSRFEEAREQFLYYTHHPEVVEDILQKGEQAARIKGKTVLAAVKKNIGLC